MTPSTWRSRWPSTIIYGFMEARHEAGPDTKHVRRERQVAVCGRRAARESRGVMAGARRRRSWRRALGTSAPTLSHVSASWARLSIRAWHLGAAYNGAETCWLGAVDYGADLQSPFLQFVTKWIYM